MLLFMASISQNNDEYHSLEILCSCNNNFNYINISQIERLHRIGHRFISREASKAGETY